MFRAKQTSLLQEVTGAEKKRNTKRADQRNDSTGAKTDAQVWHRKVAY